MKTARLERRSNRTTCRVPVAVMLIAVAISATGCAGPWAQKPNVSLPATRSTPTSLGAANKTKFRNARDIPDPTIMEPAASANGSLPSPSSSLTSPNLSAPDTTIIRGQSYDEPSVGGSDYSRSAMPASGTDGSGGVRLAQTPGGYAQGGGFGAPSYGSPGISRPGYSSPAANGFSGGPSNYESAQGGSGGYGGVVGSEDGFMSSPGYAYDGNGNPPEDGVLSPLPSDYADLVVNLRETQTGRFMFGVGVNSDLGLTAQAILDERHFDWRRWPRSLDDIVNGTAWRGGGQSLRIEAVPGTEVQRYMVNFTQPYLWDTPVSFNLSGYLFDRRYFDWDEQRLGGRIGMGYRITPDLSLSLGFRGEQVDFTNPRVRGIDVIEDALGESDIFSGKITLAHDTRDIPFAPTEGHYLELTYEQVFGTFDYPRAGIDYRRYFLLRQRADRSGRHTLGFSFRGGITGSQTPVFENYFAGGYSTLRGFRFRHASPKTQDVIVGGQLSMLNSIEYIFPITADDMLKGAIFCDHGTIEESYEDIDFGDYRVAVGAGLRINVPAMGPAPIAVDLSVPINREQTDRIQNFSFFVGFRQIDQKPLTRTANARHLPHYCLFFGD